MASALEEEALKRRERLKQMKRSLPEGEELTDADANTESANIVPQHMQLKVPKFRSYAPKHESLKPAALPKQVPEKVEEHIASHLESLKDATVINEVDLASLAPRKIDWDLKRDVTRKLERLERRTQRAIAELIRERLASGKTESIDFLAALNAGSRAVAARQDESDDDD